MNRRLTTLGVFGLGRGPRCDLRGRLRHLASRRRSAQRRPGRPRVGREAFDPDRLPGAPRVPAATRPWPTPRPRAPAGPERRRDRRPECRPEGQPEGYRRARRVALRLGDGREPARYPSQLEASTPGGAQGETKPAGNINTGPPGALSNRPGFRPPRTGRPGRIPPRVGPTPHRTEQKGSHPWTSLIPSSDWSTRRKNSSDIALTRPSSPSRSAPGPSATSATASPLDG